MSDQLTAPPSPPANAAAARASWARRLWPVPVLQAVIILVLFALLGVAVSLLVHAWWEPARGVVYDGAWRRGLLSVDPLRWEPGADESVFSATGLFAVLGLAGGAVVGGLAGLLLARQELLTLAAVTVGSLGSGALAYWLIMVRAPASPDAVVRSEGVADGAVLTDTIHLASPWLCLTFTGGALLLLMLVFMLVTGRSGASRER